MKRSFRIALVLCTIASVRLPAQQREADAAVPPPLFRPRDAVVATLFTGASIGLMQFDSRIARELRSEGAQGNSTYDAVADVASLVNEKSLLAAAIVAWAGGRITSSRTVADVGWHAAEAIIVSGVASTIVRGALGRSRPFVTADRDAFDYEPGQGFTKLSYRAFPSIHAVASFAAAAVVSGEVTERAPGAAPFVTPVVYVLAALPGLGRMYKDKHWASDVLMGGFVGTMAGRKVVRYHHSRPDTKLDRIMLGVMPTVDPIGRPAIVVAFTF